MHEAEVMKCQPLRRWSGLSCIDQARTSGSSCGVSDRAPDEQKLLRLCDAGLLDHGSEARDLGAHEALQLVERGIAYGDAPGPRKLGLDIRQLEHLLHLQMQP